MSARMYMTAAFGVILFTVSPAAIHGQVLPGPFLQEDSTDAFRSETIVIERKDGAPSTRYTLRVLIPPAYDSAAGGLPVLYYLDGWWWGGLVEDLVRLSSSATPPRTEPVILVGIVTEGDEDEWNRTRNRDLTPSHFRPIAPGVRMRVGSVELDSAGTGGAAEFLDFLEGEVIPTVEGRYRVRDTGRGIAGHSFGGLFSAWLLARRPQLFDRYLIVSPSMFWNDGEVLEQGGLGGEGMPLRSRVFVAAGSGELAGIRRGAAEFAARLGELDVEVRHVEYNGTDHLTVLPTALLAGLIYLYPSR